MLGKTHAGSLWARNYCLCALLALFSFVAFGRGFGSEFVFDSALIVGGDPRVGTFGADSVADILRENYWWPTMQSNAYRPVSTFLFLFERTVLGFGQSPAGYQLVNLMLHVAVVIGVFKLLLRLGVSATWAFFASAWFAVHPYVVEVVPNIVGLSDILALGTIVWGFFIYLNIIDGRVSVIRGFWALGVVSVIGLLSKESSVSLLGLLFWHGMTLGRERVVRRFRELKSPKIAAFVAMICLSAILSAIIIPRVVHENFNMGEGHDIGIVDNPLRGESPLVARLNAFSILGDNLVNCLVPTTISADYSFGQIQLGSFPPRDSWDWVVVCRAAAVLVFGMSGLLFISRWPAFSFAVGSVFIMAAPTANFVILIGTIRADRLIYPVIVPVLVCAGMLAGLLWRRLGRGQHGGVDGDARAARLAAGFCAFYVGLLGLLTNFRSTDWRTAEAFWSAAHQTSPDSFKTKLGFATVDREPDLDQINRDIALAKSALDQVRASPLEVVRKTDLPVEVYAATLIKRVRFQHGKVPRENLDADLNAALSLYRELLETRIEMDRRMNEHRVERGLESLSKRVKKDGVLAAIGDIMRFKGESAAGVELLRSYYKECLLSEEYLFALARLHVESGDVREGLECYIKITLLHPESPKVAPEAAWVFQHNELPAYAKPYASKADKLTAGEGARLNMADPALADIVRSSLRELNEWMTESGDLAMRSILSRRVRVFFGDDFI